MKVKSLSCVQLLATPWTAAYQAPLSMEFSRQEYWSGVPSPSLMTNLDCILKSQDIILQTTIHIVKALVFPVQFHSVAQSCPTPCDPMNRSMPGLPVHHQLLEFTQTHVHRVGDGIQPSHPLSSPSPPALNPSQHQSLFQ